MQATYERVRALPMWQQLLGFTLGAFLLLSVVRTIADADDLTSGPTFIATVAAAAPILFAGLGGLYAERVGVVNIGLEGMMVMGTWFAGWAGWHWGPWAALVGGAIGGLLGGLLHALATVTFGIDHIVSGVAINLIAPGVTRFLSAEVFVGHAEGTITTSPQMSGGLGRFRIPGLADLLETIDEKRWFFVSDIAGAMRSMVDEIAWSTLLAWLLIPISMYVLWRTRFGLRLRSIGEKPGAADSLGVNVYRMKYAGLAISGALAGLGGAWLAIDVRGYSENQVGGRGFQGLAALIFGNWRPPGVGLGAALFAYGLSLKERLGTNPIKALYLLIAVIFIVMFVVAVLRRAPLRRRNPARSVPLLLVGAGLMVFYVQTETVNNQIVYVTPYVITLLVLAFASQRLRPPAAAGQPWRKGTSG